ncbi:unnamed protein product [Adineta steineri]|uniref:C2 domain-containing protein n=1 Tax=Adineta steineri TaxID=433720 RepID=A0A818W8T8_9BILA|nr:unnamed protein product [Adineta steineri]CAF3721648.1 unnamed protein product [Adineta steineri]
MSGSHGTLEVTIVEARHLKDEDIVGKNDAFVEVYLDKDYKQRTKTIKNNNDPTWNEKFTFNLDRNHDDLHLCVYDDDAIGKDAIGSAKINLKKHDFGKGDFDEWVKLPALLGLRSKGEIHVTIHHNADSK